MGITDFFRVYVVVSVDYRFFGVLRLIAGPVDISMVAHGLLVYGGL